jgi:signal transduction histidine kinase/ActR/RegA family two-component response regulator
VDNTQSRGATEDNDHRVLVVAPTRRDAEIAQSALRQVNVCAQSCATLEELCAEVPRGAAAVLLTDDVLESSDPSHLSKAVDEQPEWSELPFVVLARAGIPSPAVSWLQARTSVTLLDRTVHLRTLVSAVQMAVRSRVRQYQVRDLLRTERQARLEADHANTAKDRFLAVLSHELRTPLTPVVFAVQTLKQQIPPSSPTYAALEMISRNVTLEAKLIDDLLDLSRVVQGKLELQKAIVDVHEKIRDTLAMVESDSRAHGVCLETSLGATSPQLFADSARLQQVLWNLAKNAIKFTNDGGTVTFATWNEGTHLCVACSDDGIGIASDVLPLIFQPFQQGGADITRQYGGLGLGLAVSRSLIEAHDGTLTASSDGPGRGAKFTIRLPTVAASILRSEPVAAADARRGRHGKGSLRILVVEDHADTARALVETLTSRGNQVTVVHSVDDGLRAAAEGHFELLISDIGLPDGSGLDLIRRILPRPTIGAIALSGFGMDEDLKRSVEAGFNRHLTKPVDVGQLVHTINELQTDASSRAAHRRSRR